LSRQVERSRGIMLLASSCNLSGRSQIR
jgi:hypothetical protein